MTIQINRPIWSSKIFSGDNNPQVKKQQFRKYLAILPKPPLQEKIIYPTQEPSKIRLDKEPLTYSDIISGDFHKLMKEARRNE